MQEVNPKVLSSLGSQEKSLFFPSLKRKFRGESYIRPTSNPMPMYVNGVVVKHAYLPPP